ncbi:peptidase inhibitor 16-like [Centruroides sculpturatus]|uniref:peptidase inhibitor 16-like n=1 Tax=Centruroides sculpturatus TaxID=218467 RepID=UPI000C6D5423|nr:peptidase inhibitor 16-like [Centruroides sculpturatus]
MWFICMILLYCFFLPVNCSKSGLFLLSSDQFESREISKEEYFNNSSIVKEIKKIYKRSSKKYGFTEDERSDILNLINFYRNNTKPMAANMMKLEWSDTLANLAKLWSDRCNVDESSGPAGCLHKINQNVYIGYEPFETILQIWNGESQHYNYSNATCDKNSNCDKYLTMISADVRFVGCSLTDCLKTGFKFMMVCNYFPKINIRGKAPYQSGEACSKCNGSRCENSLCG